MSALTARYVLSSRIGQLPILLAPAVFAITLAPRLALAQSYGRNDPYMQGSTRPLDGSPRSGIYSSRPAPSYQRTPDRLGYERPPTSMQPPIWSGVYAGVNAGYGWQSTTIEGWGVPTATQGAGRLGGHVGYNWQISSFVVGMEGDLTRASGSTTLAAGGAIALMQTSWESTLRARAGVMAGPALFYATGGAAFNNQRTTLTSALPTLSNNDVRFGTVLGAGAEFKLAPNISTRIEALRYDFRESSTSLNVGGVKQHDTVVRAGLSIHLN